MQILSHFSETLEPSVHEYHSGITHGPLSLGFAMATVMCLAPQRKCAGIAVEMVPSMQREQPGFPDKHQAV